MKYNKTEEKLMLGQPSLKLCFSYNTSHEQEHPICFILLDLKGKSGEKNPKTWKSFLIWKKIVHNDTTY